MDGQMDIRMDELITIGHPQSEALINMSLRLRFLNTHCIKRVIKSADAPSQIYDVLLDINEI